MQTHFCNVALHPLKKHHVNEDLLLEYLFEDGSFFEDLSANFKQLKTTVIIKYKYAFSIVLSFSIVRNGFDFCYLYLCQFVHSLFVCPFLK